MVSGGGKGETLIPGPGGKARGGAYGDLVVENPVTKERLIINTVDTYADGITATSREVAAGAKIQNLEPGAQFMMVPKPKPGQMMAAGAAAIGAGGAQASDGGILGTGMTWGDVRSFGADVVNFGVDFLTPGGVGDVVADLRKLATATASF